MRDWPLKSKEQFINKSFFLDLPANRTPTLKLLLIEINDADKTRREIMWGELKLDGHSKDVVYRDNVSLYINRKVSKRFG